MHLVYAASKLDHAPMWRKLQQEWKDSVLFTSRWIDLIESRNDTDPETLAIAWEENERHIRACSCLLLYAEPQDNLRGALVEAGMAIGMGKHVILAGTNPKFGTWRYHPLVYVTFGLQSARRALDLICV